MRVHGLPPNVQTVNLAGEPLAESLVAAILKTGTVRRVYDLYGPTETTTYSTFTERQPGAPATIGRPIANTRIHLLDSALESVPIGIAGDLYIGLEVRTPVDLTEKEKELFQELAKLSTQKGA